MSGQRAVLEFSPEDVGSSAMRVFLSYSAADRKIAERLKEGLRDRGLSVAELRTVPGVQWRAEVEEAIRSVDDILVLVGARRSDDPAQQLTWQAALEAVWEDSRKRLIPILLRDAALPPFVYGDASGDETRVIRIVNPRDVRSAVPAILLALRRDGQDSANEGPPSKLPRLLQVEAYDPAGPEPDSVSVETKGTFSYDAEVERRDRLHEIKKLAERLKP